MTIYERQQARKVHEGFTYLSRACWRCEEKPRPPKNVEGAPRLGLCHEHILEETKRCMTGFYDKPARALKVAR